MDNKFLNSMLNFICAGFLDECNNAGIKKYKNSDYIFWDDEYRCLYYNRQQVFSKIWNQNEESVANFNIINNLYTNKTYLNAKEILVITLKDYINRNAYQVTNNEIEEIIYKYLGY